MSDKPELPLPAPYEVGYGKPPQQNRFKPGQSGNAKGRPKGRKSKIPPLYEERLKNLFLAEAYREVPIHDRGRKKTVSMVAANLRALAVNGAKGNNRAANLFTTAIMKIESERKELNNSYFKSALDYKDAWDKELRRRRKLGLDLPDPIPHPDDMVLDARNGTVHMRGPKTKDDLELWQMGEFMIELLHKERESFIAKLALETEPISIRALENQIASNAQTLKGALRIFGPPEIRRAPPHMLEIEDEFDIDLTGWTKYQPPGDDEPSGGCGDGGEA